LDIPLFIFGIILNCFGIFQIGKGISLFKKVFKYTSELDAFSAWAGSTSIMAGIIAILESFQLRVVDAINSKSKIIPINLPRFILGIGLIFVGIWTIILQIKWYRKGLKDPLWYGVRLLILGFGFTVFGIILIIQSF